MQSHTREQVVRSEQHFRTSKDVYMSGKHAECCIKAAFLDDAVLSATVILLPVLKSGSVAYELRHLSCGTETGKPFISAPLTYSWALSCSP
eukprot:1142136-Pelagomonas_calceolata.AAC.2